MSRYTRAQLDAYAKLKVEPIMFTQKAFHRALERNGCVKKGKGGKNVVWDVRLSSQSLKSFGVYGTHTATERGDYTQASLPWAAVYVDDALSGLEKDRNSGEVNSQTSGKVRSISTQALDELKEDLLDGFNNQLIQGDGASLNGGSGVTFTGLEQFVAASPSTGTYAGINRATVSDWQNQQFAGNAGPSSSWAQDAWWAILKMKTDIIANAKAGRTGKITPDVLLVTAANYVDVKNKGYSQNTNVGASVKSIEMIEGMEMEIETDLDASQIYMLSSKSMKFCWLGRRLVNIYHKSELESHVHPDDEALVAFIHGQLICERPDANGVITSAS